MCTVAELKQYLSTFPDDTIVDVLKEVTKGSSTYMDYAPIDLAFYEEIYTFVRNTEGASRLRLVTRPEQSCAQ